MTLASNRPPRSSDSISRKRHSLRAVCLLAAACSLSAAQWLSASPAPMQSPGPGLAAQARFVGDTRTPGALTLVANGVAAPVLVDTGDFAGVGRAANDLRADIARVSGVEPRLVHTPPTRAAAVVVVGSIERSSLIRSLADRHKLDVSTLRGKWESSVIEVVSRPWPGVDQALVIVGSDQRGTIYGVYDLSEQVGVSPWYWWADAPVPHRASLFVRPGRVVRNEPAVRYRGFFINDEAPALSGWARQTFGGFNHQFYGRVFELLLRLKGNLLWPAMWGNAFADDDAQSPVLANEYGVVIGTSHHEPMMRAHDEWRRYGTGPWSYEKNADALRAFWTEGVKRSANYETITTVGMRGDGDEPMSRDANVALLERIVADQRDILSKVRGPDLTKIPQVWALYKEVQEYYEKGMRVPDDVTLLWSDDNWGNIRRLPTAEERKRSGGAGVYYHLDYVGGPRNYKWLNTVPVAKVWEQMHLAWEYGATRIWIVNVGDIKPVELPLQFFLDYAWNPKDAVAPERLRSYTESWAEQQFGREHAVEIADLLAKYTTFNSRRKPEMLDPRTYSLVNYREAETVVADYNNLSARAEALYATLPPAARDAFFQLVLYPIKACATVNEMYFTVGLNRLFAVQGRQSTNDLAARARELFRKDEALSREYNEKLAGGKWAHMMDQTRIGYTYWQQPLRNAMPGVQEVQVPAAAEMGVSVEGSEGSWPDGGVGVPTVPALSVYDKAPRYIEIYNRGQQPFDYTIERSSPWLDVDRARGTVERDRRIMVSARWADVPLDATSASLTISGPNGVKVEVTVPILNPATPRPEQLDGFVETNGYVSVEAAHYTNATAPSGRSWTTIADHGRTLSGVTAWPVTPDRSLTTADGMRLEYRMYLFTKGQATVSLQLAPTQRFQPEFGPRIAVSFDDDAPVTLNLNADESTPAWERSVGDGVKVMTSKHPISTPGYHVLKVWALDPGVVVQKVVVNTGTMRPSYLGPPESVAGKR